MGVTPAQVTRASDIKDFKVDWSLKSWAISPNLSIESQPVWELFYNRSRLDKYQHASGFMRRLASADLSVGTVQNEEADRRIGFAVKLNLFKQRDPLLARQLYLDVDSSFEDQQQQLEKKLRTLLRRLDTTKDILKLPEIQSEIQNARQDLAALGPRRTQEINRRAALFVQKNWNSASLDIAFGRIYTYQTDSTGSLLKLRLNRNTAWGAWLSGGFGIGRKLLLSGLIRSSWYQEALSFVLHDSLGSNSSDSSAVAENSLFSLGLNLRYGGSIFNFFIELFYEQKGLRTATAALNKAFRTPPGLTVATSSVNWNVVDPNTINFGGSWRIGINLVLDYGMRCIFDQHWKMQTFTPVVGLACMMR